MSDIQEILMNLNRGRIAVSEAFENINDIHNVGIDNLKSEIEQLRKIVDYMEDAHCDCSDFADYGVHGKNCHVTRLRKGLGK